MNEYMPSFLLQDPGSTIMRMEDPAESRVMLYLTPADLAILGMVVAEQSKGGNGWAQQCASLMALFLEQIYIELTDEERECMKIGVQ